ncbi:hypothetical protein FHX63_004263 [Cupriavidus plantarum]|nr:hypothetical protein [Cupriavidus plantarum]CAG2151569.1 hypothetical protein LMG26296_04963 [Cupriavidus plantarum]SMR85141.1 Protein of unknown function [Cupriavidus plantarum]
MSHRLMRVVLPLLMSMAVSLAVGPAHAQAKLDNGQIDQLLAPIALYPDALLSQVLMASTYPSDVAAAAQWSKSNASLSGDAAVKAVQGETWDPSVQSLVAFPSVIDMMGRQPQWVQSVGDAFLAQPDDVMNGVQRLRVQAQKAGSLKTTPQQKVVTQQSGGTTIVQIEPADPQVVYVPSYNPTVVYGTWPYPAYPPAYYPPPPGSVFATSLVAGIGFGLGVAAVNSLWGGCDWGHHDVNINVNRYNNINVNRQLDVNRSNVNWQHNPAARGNVPYSNPAVANRYDGQRQQALANRGQAGQQAGQRLGEGGGGQQAGQRLGQGGAGQQAGQQAGRQLGQGGAGQQPASGQQRLGAGGGGMQAQPGARDGTRDSARDSARDRAAQSFQGHTGQSIAGHGGGMTADPRPAGADRQRADAATARNRSQIANRDSALRDAGNGQRLQQQGARMGQQQGGFQRTGGAPAHGAVMGHGGHGRR